MRVLHLISGGDTGGAKTHVLTLLEELKKKVDIQLVCLTGGLFYEEALELGIDTIVLEQKSRFDLSVNRKLIKLIIETKTDLLHCHGARANFISTFIKKKIGIPVITTVHSDYKQDFSHSLYKKIVFTWLNKYSLNKMDYYLAVTNIFKHMLGEQGFNISKVFVIYNGIKVIDSPKTNFEKITFGCVTRLVPIKGTHILLEAVNKCVELGYEPIVKIAGIGEGTYVEKLFDYVSDHHLEKYIEFSGFIKEIDEFYKTIQVNILPSYTESFPYALLEGGIRSKGTIASKAGGIIEMIDDMKTGRLFDVANVEQLANCMIDYMENPKKVEIYGLNFREKIMNDFSDVSMANKHVEIYNTIIKNKKNH